MPGRLSHCCLFVSTDHQPAGCCCTLNTNFCRVFADWWRAGRDGLEQGKFLGSADALTRRARPVAPHLIKHWLFPAEPGATAPALVHAARRHVVSTRTPAGSGAARQTLAEDTAVTRREALRTYGSSSAPSLSEPLLGTTPSCPDCSAPITPRGVWDGNKKKRSFSSHSSRGPSTPSLCTRCVALSRAGMAWHARARRCWGRSARVWVADRRVGALVPVLHLAATSVLYLLEAVWHGPSFAARVPAAQRATPGGTACVRRARAGVACAGLYRAPRTCG